MKHKIALLPLTFFLSIGLFLSLSTILQKLFLSYPLDLWEAGALVQSWQHQQGISIYKNNDAAAWMYGPLKTYFIGTLFNLTGFNLYLGRLLSLVAISATIGVLINLFSALKQNKLIYTYIAICIIFIYELKLGIFVQTRPEAIPIFLSILFLILFYQAFHKNSFPLILLSAIVLVIAFFFKQTVAGVSVIPLVAIILSRKNVFKPINLLFLLVPICSILALIGYLNLFQPEMYYYMIEVPSKYDIPPSSFVKWIYNFLVSIPIFYLFFYDWLVDSKESDNDSKTMQENDYLNWILASILVMTATGILAAAKEGGTWNSLAYSFFSIYAFLLLRMEQFLDQLANLSKRSTFKALLLSSLVGGLFLLGGLSGKTSGFKQSVSGYGDSSYREVIQISKSLQGKVICPQDPTIPLIANGYAGKSIIFEYDASGWQWPLSSILTELESADYVITLGKNGSWRKWPFMNQETILGDLNFSLMTFDEIENSDYRIWKNQNKLS